jgi:hypothetical protein
MVDLQGGANPCVHGRAGGIEINKITPYSIIPEHLDQGVLDKIVF